MTRWLLTILALWLPVACGTTPAASDPSSWSEAAVAEHADHEHEDEDEDEDETPIPLADVPAHVLAAARAALPGFVPAAAEIEHEGGANVYEIEGLVGDELWEVEVTPSGDVLEVEREDDEDVDD